MDYIGLENVSCRSEDPTTIRRYKAKTSLQCANMCDKIECQMATFLLNKNVPKGGNCILETNAINLKCTRASALTLLHSSRLRSENGRLLTFPK